MKILVLTERLAPVGGTEIYVTRQLEALAARGHEVAAISGDPEAPALPPGVGWRRDAALFSASLRPGALRRGGRAARALGVELLHRGWDAALVHKLDQPAALLELRGKVAVLRFVHTAWATCPAGTRWLPRSSSACVAGPGLRCLLTDRREGCLGLAAGTRGAKDTLRRLLDVGLQRKFLIGADLVVANSAYTAGRIAQHTGGAAELEILAPPLSALDARPVPARVPVSTAEAWAGDARSGALFVGRLTPFKGADHAIRAVARCPGVRLVIAGEGPERAGLEGLARALGVGERVDFAGWLSDAGLAEARARAAVTLFPSLWPEPYGMAGLEALASGCPVIAYDTGGVQAWLSPATGVLVPPGDHIALAEALSGLLADPGRRERLGRAGQALGEARSFARFTDATEAAIERARARFARRLAPTHLPDRGRETTKSEGERP